MRVERVAVFALSHDDSKQRFSDCRFEPLNSHVATRG